MQIKDALQSAITAAWDYCNHTSETMDIIDSICCVAGPWITGPDAVYRETRKSMKCQLIRILLNVRRR